MRRCWEFFPRAFNAVGLWKLNHEHKLEDFNSISHSIQKSSNKNRKNPPDSATSALNNSAVLFAI